MSTGLALAAFHANAGDWPQYRGPAHDGTSGDGIIQNWTGSVTNPVWLVLVTNCLGSIAVSGGRAVTQTRRMIDGADKEVCVALSTIDGSELWATPTDDANYPQGGVGYDDGPRSTPALDNDSVYVLSSYLNLYRLNATNGAVIWQKDLRALYGGDVIGYQNCASPLIENGLIYLNANSPSNSLMALYTTNGEPAWRSQMEPMTHSTPVLATIHGVRQVIFATQNGLISLDPLSGNLLWQKDYPFSYFISLAVSPVVSGDMVFTCGAYAYGEGSVVVQAKLTNQTWTATQLWSAADPSAHWMTPIARQGFIYGQFGIQRYDTTNAQLDCIDMRTGTVKWSVPGFGRCATLLVNDQLLVLTEVGDLVLASTDTNAYTELGRFNAIPNYYCDTNKCWNSPAVANGRVYVRSTSFAACYDLSVPALKFDSPTRAAPGQFQLTIRAADGSPITSSRLAGISLLSSTNLNTPLAAWAALSNTLVLTSGVVRINNADAIPARGRFYIVREPK